MYNADKLSEQKRDVTLWRYATDEATVEAPGYFNDAADLLRVNDIIVADLDTENQHGGGRRKKLFIVTANDAGVVGIEVLV